VSCEIRLTDRWISGRELDRALLVSGGPHASSFSEVAMHVGPNSGVMVDAAVRVLSLLNQLVLCTKLVSLDFAGGVDGAMTYLNRMRFFDFLSHDVKVTPTRPRISLGALRKGRTPTLVELAGLNPSSTDKKLPGELTDRLVAACGSRADRQVLERAAFTVFSELIGNVYQHSDTKLDGFAALQVYKNGGVAKVVVSDSGKGILGTLRPTLTDERLTHLGDTDLVVEIFRQGLSRHGSSRGCGLKTSADHAIRFKADLDVRLPNCNVHLTPSRGAYLPNTAHCREKLPLLWGTHLCFDFKLSQ
jgi:hypothetical protein